MSEHAGKTGSADETPAELGGGVDEELITLTALTLAENEYASSIKHWAQSIEVPIPAVGVSPELRTLLGIAARHDVAVPRTHKHEGDHAEPRHKASGSSSRRRRRAPRRSA